MKNRYYQITKKENPESNGNVLELKEGKLEIVAGEVFKGENLPGNFFIEYNNENILKIGNKDYEFREISSSEADKLIKDYQNLLGAVCFGVLPKKHWRDTKGKWN